MFATDPQAFLGVGHALGGRSLVPEEKILQGSHTRVDEHERGVALGHHGCGRDDFVAFGCEKIEELTADGAGSHVWNVVNVDNMWNLVNVSLECRVESK